MALTESPRKNSQHREENQTFVPQNCENSFPCGCKLMGDILIYQVRTWSNVQ